MMIHDEVREARIRAGLSQNTLARLARVPRSQLRKLEEGGNVTLATVQKILDQLPGVQMTLAPAQVDESALHEALMALVAAAHRVLEVLGEQPGQPASVPPPQPASAPFSKPAKAPVAPMPRHDQGPVGATRFYGGREREREMAKQLQKSLEDTLSGIEKKPH